MKTSKPFKEFKEFKESYNASLFGLKTKKVVDAQLNLHTISQVTTRAGIKDEGNNGLSSFFNLPITVCY